MALVLASDIPVNDPRLPKQFERWQQWIQQNNREIESVKAQVACNDRSAVKNPRWYPSPPLAADDIRLLEILPGNAAEPLACQMTVASLKAQPQYEALSYTWGGSAELRSVMLEGVAGFPVTDNAYAALMRFRKSDQKTTIWIDAICINQADTDERGRQVSMMGEIYRQACRVLVWLGDYGTSNISGLAGEELEVQGAMKAVFWGGQPRWWERAWIVQEVAHAKAVDVYFGKFCKPWADFCYQVFDLRTGGRSKHSSVRHLVEWERSQRWSRTEMAKQVVEIFELIGLVQSYRIDATQGRSPPPTIFELAVQTRAQICKDLRDKVYSIASLLSPTETALVPIDYSVDRSVVYSRATYASIVGQGCFDIFRLCNFDHKLSSVFPTWTIDFAQITHDFLETSFFSPTQTLKWPGQTSEIQNMIRLARTLRRSRYRVWILIQCILSAP